MNTLAGILTDSQRAQDATVMPRESNETALFLDNAIDNLIQAGMSKSTLRAYKRVVADLHEWIASGQGSLAGAVGVKQVFDFSDFSDNQLARYITHLHTDRKLAPSSISQSISAIKWLAGQMQHTGLVSEINSPDSLTSRTMKGIRRAGKDRGAGQVDGVTWEKVDAITLLSANDGSITALRDAALIRLMSDCLLRVSEVVSVNIEDLQGNSLTIKQSKTDPEGHGEVLYVTDEGVTLIKRYAGAANITTGALFRRIRKGDIVTDARLSDRSAREIIKKRAAGVVGGRISGHSLRVGSAISLAKNKASVVEMQTAGRWKDSKMPGHYAKAELAERGAIARYRDGK